MLHEDEVDWASDYETEIFRNVFTDSPDPKDKTSCTSYYPVCDTSVSSYPMRPLCDRSSYKVRQTKTRETSLTIKFWGMNEALITCNLIYIINRSLTSISFCHVCCLWD